MSTVLYIKANPKPDNMSYTFKMSEAFISSYKEKNPGDEIVTLDLYKEGVRFLDAENHHHYRINRGAAGGRFRTIC